VVVGHSLGFAWALANIPRPWAGALAINGFPRFTHAPDFPDGVPQRVVGKMLARLVTAPEEVVSDFLGRCGQDGVDTRTLVHAPLQASLSWLALCDEREALAGLDCPVAALAGGADPIVPEAMSRLAFDGRDLDIVPEAGHLLPMTHPDRVASAIAAFRAACG
jgi:pimeloyl-[acyl-carrier protein] methyl ester esterase